MKEILRYGSILALVCLIATGLLAGVNRITKPRIFAQAQKEEAESLREIMPEAKDFVPVELGDDIIYYKVYGKQQEFIGVTFQAQAKGYSSTINTLVGMKKDGSIIAIKVLNQNETPGLGARISEAEFSSQFANKNFSSLSRAQAITGATISSMAVIDSVKEKAKGIQDLIKNEK